MRARVGRVAGRVEGAAMKRTVPVWAIVWWDGTKWVPDDYTYPTRKEARRIVAVMRSEGGRYAAVRVSVPVPPAPKGRK